MMTNALLDLSGLPPFDRFNVAQITPAIDQLISTAQAAVKAAETAKATWADFYLPLEESTEALGRAWGIVGHLNAVADSPELREAYEFKLPEVTAFWTELGQNKLLFKQYQAIKSSSEFDHLPQARKKIIDNALRDFVLSGAALKSPARERYASIQEEMAIATQEFSKHVLDATNAFSLTVTDLTQLAGIPQDVIDAARQQAQDAGVEGWQLNLRMPCYLPVMQYAESSALRKTLHEAYVTRASELGLPAQDNTQIISQILRLRAEEAALLGYDTYADVSLASKMAKEPSAVIRFLRDMAAKARPFAVHDKDALQRFAKEHLSLAALNPWDVAFASEKLKEASYAFSDIELKQYFPVPSVLAGLFSLITKLFDVQVTADSAATWHPDVQFFKVEKAGKLIGQFYLDLYARPSKRGGAWMDDARGRCIKGNAVQTPVAYLTCNFMAPAPGKASLLTHDEVITLFHETGHGLHHLLTHVDDLAVSGINGVEWDAVELPSQFMENFCWDWQVLQSMTQHVDTREKLPRVLYDKMISAKNFQSGLATVRQLEFSLFDMLIHAASSSSDPVNVQSVLDAVRAEVAVIKPAEFNRFQNSFSHIFAGGYAAGYYSYKWAEVLSADCYAAFEEQPDHFEQMGSKFLKEILSAGGSRPAIDSFRAFRGRAPLPDALLRHNGMSETSFDETSHA